jgi:regulator of replication initiation timing
MLKKSALTVMFIILCGAASVAQNNISREDYEKLVDYVNCYYAVKYISHNPADIKDNNNKTSFNKYKNAFENKVQSYSDISVRIDESVSNSASVYNALKRFAGYYPKPKALWKYIDDKKGKFDENWSPTEMIDFLILLSDDEITIPGQKVNFKTSLKNVTEALKKDLRPQISSKSPQTTGSIGESSGTAAGLTGEETENTEKDKNKGHGFGFYFRWILVIAIVAIAAWKRKWLFPWIKETFDLLTKMTDRLLNKWNEIKQKISNLKSKNESLPDESDEAKQEISDLKSKIKEIEHENENLAQSIKQYETGNSNLRIEKKQLEQKIRELERALQNATTAVPQPQPEFIPEIQEKPSALPNASTLYSDAIVDGFFHKVRETPNEDTVFELHPQAERAATFTVYAGACQLVIKRPEFLEGCDKQVLNNAQSVKVESPGTAQKQPDGKWRITKKLNVIIR